MNFAAVNCIVLALGLSPACAEVIRETTFSLAPAPGSDLHAAWLEEVARSRQRVIEWRAGLAHRFRARLNGSESPDLLANSKTGSPAALPLDIFLHDFTLRAGDIVVTRQGFRLYTGENGAPDPSDFPLIDAAGHAGVAPLSVRMTRASR